MRLVWFCIGMLGVTLGVADGVEVNNIRFEWDVVSNEVVMTVEAPTTGWVSVGWGAAVKMKDADFVIGYVTNGSYGVLEDHFGVSPTGHRLDTDLGGRVNVRLLEAQEKDGKTRIVFVRSLVTKDAYDKDLVLDKPFDVILAYGRFDNTTSKHSAIGKVKIFLKRKP